MGHPTGSYEFIPGTHFELLNEVTEDGYVIKSERANHKDYKTSGECLRDGEKLPMPKSPEIGILGNTFVYSIICRRVKNGTA